MKNYAKVSSHIFLVIIVLTSSWTYRLFANASILTTAAILSLAYLIFSLLSKEKKHLSYLAILVNISLLLLTLSGNVDLNIFTTSRVEQDVLIRRFDNYAKDYGKLYMNRYGILYHYKLEPIIYKLEANLFENMDINGYFFASHPRERGTNNEFEKFSAFFLPFFVIGFFATLIYQRKAFIFFVVNLLLSTLYYSNYVLGSVLLYAYFVVFITYGFKICLRKARLLSKNH